MRQTELGHHRVCVKCGQIQRYGKAYASNKHPQFEKVKPCPGWVPINERPPESQPRIRNEQLYKDPE
eukprot:CAMPEP_0184706126 /NCGR_PEP_ID=MMETSP0313-20130426/36599_1 /TAXON_ID=2792 /ORGANISM="Porphyridium aerugineum, Strain SAG 1380-2" /LENGTH=66 /DNA_ID=CAMNT_0027167671 /DNA_START=105 /DNA_END=305 /DNA_ORIENTATION=+